LPFIQQLNTCRGDKLEWPRKIVSLLKANDICSIIETIARGAGFKQALTVDSFSAYKKALSQILIQPGSWILVVKTDSSIAPGRPPKSPVYIKNQFMEALRNV
jgi:hypothetical protein